MGKRELAIQNTAYVMKDSEFDMPVTEVIQKKQFKEHDFDQWETQYSCLKSNEDCHLRQLEAENRRLKMIIEDLTQDKLAQAHRIKELELEKSRIKHAFAELTLCQQMLKNAL